MCFYMAYVFFMDGGGHVGVGGVGGRRAGGVVDLAGGYF